MDLYPPVGGCSRFFTSRIRRRNHPRLPAEYQVSDTVTPELQVVSIGDVCFVGVPGELCNEYGLEIKWHSPFRKAFIAYVSTAYLHYICQTNLVVSGGYEGDCQVFSTRDSVKFLQTLYVRISCFINNADTLRCCPCGSYSGDIGNPCLNGCLS